MLSERTPHAPRMPSNRSLSTGVGDDDSDGVRLAHGQTLAISGATKQRVGERMGEFQSFGTHVVQYFWNG